MAQDEIDRADFLTLQFFRANMGWAEDFVLFILLFGLFSSGGKSMYREKGLYCAIVNSSSL